MTQSENFSTIVNYDDFPFRVRVEGCTGIGEDFHSIDLITLQNFGYRHGDCEIDEYDNHIGRCPDASISCDGYTIPDEYLSNYGNFYYYDEYGEYQKIECPVEGPCTIIFDCPHSHNGVWCIEYLGKIGYDYCEALYRFRNEADALFFCILLSSYCFKKFNYLGTDPYKSIRSQWEEKRQIQEKSMTKLQKLKRYISNKKRDIKYNFNQKGKKLYDKFFQKQNYQ